jgi:hypothetical protein
MGIIAKGIVPENSGTIVYQEVIYKSKHYPAARR